MISADDRDPCKPDIFTATYERVEEHPAEPPRHVGHAGATRTTSPTDGGQPVQDRAGAADGRTAGRCDALCADIERDRDQLLTETARLEQQVIDMGGAVAELEELHSDLHNLATTWAHGGQPFAADDLRAVLDKARTTNTEETP